jgi:hypothetical protein
MTAMSPATSTKQHRRPPVVALLVLPLVAALVLTVFAWPQARMEPRDLPVGVAGPPAAAEPLEQRLAAGGDAFDVHRYADEAAAREAIRDRDVYGAFVATADGPKLLTASAASPAVAQLLTHAAGEGRSAVQVEDVEPAQRGGALASSILPLILAGLLTAVLSGLLASGALRRAGLLVAGSLLVGVTAAVIVQPWLDVVEGDFAANAAALSLTVLAVAAFAAGLRALLGEAGLGVAALTMVLVGNPFAGVASGPEMLPEPVGGLGQLMPPGAGGNLLRSTGFFEGAAAGGHVAVLGAWALAGLAALFGASLLRRRATSSAPARMRTAGETS